MKHFFKRVRRIGAKHSSLSGKIYSHKNGKKIQFESSLERDFIYITEFDKDIVSYVDQPVRIVYRDFIGKRRSYVPDFFVKYADPLRKTEFIEIKYTSYLIKYQDRLVEKLNAAEEFCRSNGFIFRVLTEKEIRQDNGIYLKNAIFMLGYRNVFDGLSCTRTIERISHQTYLIQNKIEELGSVSVSRLLDLISSNEYERRENLFLIWYLLSRNYIESNLRVELNLNSIIWRA